MSAFVATVPVDSDLKQASDSSKTTACTMSTHDVSQDLESHSNDVDELVDSKFEE